MVEVMRHELRRLVRSRRVFGIAVFYLGLAAVGGATYLWLMRSVDAASVLHLLGERALPEDASEVAVGAQVYLTLLQLVAGTQVFELALPLRTSLILPAVQWAALAFLPWVVVLTSFDHVTGDLQRRSVLYTLTRISRTHFLLGKVLAQSAAYGVLMLLSTGAVIAFGLFVLPDMEIMLHLAGTARLWMILVPVGVCYVALATLASCLGRSSVGALLTALGILFALRVVTWWGRLASDSSWMQGLRWLSPSAHERGLWLGGWQSPALACLAYCLFAAAFVGLSLAVLRSRDL